LAILIYNRYMVTKSRERYMLVDGNALIHRGYHAIPVLNTKTGEQTNAVYGFTMILLKAIKDLKPTHIACTFDLEGPTFRHERYKEYKAHRVKGDQEMYDQIKRVKEVVNTLGIQIFEKKGFEADDVLGTLVKGIRNKELGIRNENFEIMIATGDLDTLQLVDEYTKVYTLRKGITDTVVYDEKAVRKRYGINPDQMVDYKALRGDPSDNIPGVKGIGEKTASDLIKEFKSIDKLYGAIKANKIGGGIKPRILELLKMQEEQARMSYELSTIDCKVPTETEVLPYDFNSSRQQTTVKLFQELEFRSLLGKLPKTEAGKSDEPEGGKPDVGEIVVRPFMGQVEADKSAHYATSIGKQDYQLVDTEEKLEKVLEELFSVSEIVVDTETTGLDTLNAELVGIGLCAKIGEAFYVPAGLALKSEKLKELLEDINIKKIGHNLKYDLQILQANSYKLTPLHFDTMIASYLLNAGSRQHNLDTLSFNELGYQKIPTEDLIGKGKNQITMKEVPVEKVSFYCCEDADMTMRLKELFEPQIKKEGLQKIFNEIEMPLVEVLAEMENYGIKLDTDFLNKLSSKAEIQIKDLENQIYKLTGENFNINSPKQLKEVLFGKLGLVSVDNKKTKTGLSTAADELNKMAGQHPAIEKILEYREVTKLQNTYLSALPGLVNKKTGRVHTSYNQTVAATGRLSSTDPNLQNIPVRGEGIGSEIRKAFVAEKGHKLLSLDYSQIELRIVAHLASDKKMLEVFKNNMDIHTKTAMEIFGVSEKDVTKDMRRDAKTINFGILYGLSSFGLSSRIVEISRSEAKEFIEKYFKAYPAVEEYIEQIKLQVNEEGFVKNELGRLRKFSEIRSSQWQIRAAAERAAVNFPIQSLAADVIKVAMINIHRVIGESDRSEIRMLLQVHDELVFEVLEDKVEYWAKKLIPMMENAIKLSVPVRVEGKVGDNWGEMEELGYRY
jgi:DNA polymerase I